MNVFMVSSLGLLLDIIGAWLVAIEVVKQFRGEKYSGGPICAGGNTTPMPTTIYSKWEKSKHCYMKWGLFLLTIGFLVQIAANFLNYQNPTANQSTPIAKSIEK